MSQQPQLKKSLNQLNNLNCTRKECLSQNRGHLQLAWFGNSFTEKQLTCSSCLLLNEQAMKKSIPAGFNVLPLLNFNDTLLKQYKIYNDRKASSSFHPTMLTERKKELKAELTQFDQRMLSSLKALYIALEGFLKKVDTKNKQIFANETLQQIIEMNNKDSFEKLLQKINILLKTLNYSDLTNNYEFDKIEIRNKNIQKLKQKIKEVNQKVQKVMKELLSDLKRRNEQISKI